MTKSTITRERLEQLADNNTICKVSWDERIELAQIALAAMDSEPVAWIVHARTGDQLTTDSGYVANAEGILGLHSTPLYRHAQQPVVDADDNFYSWFGREWQENYQHNQYTTAAKQMLGVMAESAWKAGRRAAMLQAGNSPVIPEGLIAAVNRLLDSDGSRGCYSAIRCGDAHDEIERLLAAAPEVK